ncbi:CIA30-domain-containing protein [Serendipita vermifera]|nr:CIA30-domain-containing protein [Serendipita vermifera]
MSKRMVGNVTVEEPKDVILFPPWQVERWRQVDDSVRGGASYSEIKRWHHGSDHNQGSVMFQGHLDTSVLGGAGFASQKFEFSSPLDLGSDNLEDHTLRLTVHPIDRPDDSPKDFCITLKSERPPPPSQPKPRSQLTYEASFVAPTPSIPRLTVPEPPLSLHTSSFKKKEQVVRDNQHVEIDLPLSSFVPTYRGKTVPRDDPKWAQLDTRQIFELGVMCRSEFGKQQGDFQLLIERIEILSFQGDTNAENARQQCQSRTIDGKGSWMAKCWSFCRDACRRWVSGVQRVESAIWNLTILPFRRRKSRDLDRVFV